MKEKEKRAETEREKDWWKPLGLHLEYIDLWCIYNTNGVPIYREKMVGKLNMVINLDYINT